MIDAALLIGEGGDVGYNGGRMLQHRGASTASVRALDSRRGLAGAGGNGGMCCVSKLFAKWARLGTGEPKGEDGRLIVSPA